MKIENAPVVATHPAGVKELGHLDRLVRDVLQDADDVVILAARDIRPKVSHQQRNLNGEGLETHFFVARDMSQAMYRIFLPSGKNWSR